MLKVLAIVVEVDTARVIVVADAATGALTLVWVAAVQVTEPAPEIVRRSAQDWVAVNCMV